MWSRQRVASAAAPMLVMRHRHCNECAFAVAEAHMEYLVLSQFRDVHRRLRIEVLSSNSQAT